MYNTEHINIILSLLSGVKTHLRQRHTSQIQLNQSNSNYFYSQL